MKDELIAHRVSGITAILAGVAVISWATLNGVTSGGLDAGEAAVGFTLAYIGQLLIIAWNLLLLPVALFLGEWLKPKSPYLITLYTWCGIASCLLWAIDVPVMEVSWIFLSGIWWLGIGFALRSEHKITGIFTIIVGFSALLDAVVTVLNLPHPWLFIAGIKIPLALIWNIWIGVVLLLPVKKQITPILASEPA